jgi:hypothetical protein
MNGCDAQFETWRLTDLSRGLVQRRKPKLDSTARQIAKQIPNIPRLEVPYFAFSLQAFNLCE